MFLKVSSVNIIVKSGFILLFSIRTNQSGSQIGFIELTTSLAGKKYKKSNNNNNNNNHNHDHNHNHNHNHNNNNNNNNNE